MSAPCGVCMDLKHPAQHTDRQSRRGGWTPDYMNVVVKHLRDFNTPRSHGCRMCDFVSKAASHFGLAPDDYATVMIRTNDLGDTTLFLPSLSRTVQIYTPIGQPPAWDDLVNGRDLSQHPNSPEAYAFIEECLSRCSKHPKCKPVSSHAPTRLIEVGASHNADVRLIETQPSTQYDYIALSYCWGTSKVFKTTTANYEEARNGIRIALLPQTIQDAISVTRGLKQNYLWVDAICIIQDSAPDWETESANMASVYRNAYLTLAAATSDAATSGFLNHRHPTAEHEHPFMVEWHSPLGEPSTLGARVVPDLTIHTLDLDDEDVLPLSLRGWTLQESKLSRRMVTYTREELWWSCLSQSSCECMTLDKIPEERKLHSFKSLYSLTSPGEIYQEWHHIVTAYTSRALAIPGDRLPAVSGIARVIQERVGSRYIAGLWAGNFVGDLAWIVVNGYLPLSSAVPAASQYRAPTFSWASVEQEVYYSTESPWVSSSSCTVLGVQSTVLGRNPLGQVQCASATLRGLMGQTTLQVELAYTDDFGDAYEYKVSMSGRDIRVIADTALESFDFTHRDGSRGRSVRRSPSGSSQGQAESGTPVFLFYLGYCRGSQPPQRSNPPRASRAYLVLGKSPADSEKYERLGILTENHVMDAQSPKVEEDCQILNDVEGFAEATITLV